MSLPLKHRLPLVIVLFVIVPTVTVAGVISWLGSNGIIENSAKMIEMGVGRIKGLSEESLKISSNALDKTSSQLTQLGAGGISSVSSGLIKTSNKLNSELAGQMVGVGVKTIERNNSRLIDINNQALESLGKKLIDNSATVVENFNLLQAKQVANGVDDVLAIRRATLTNIIRNTSLFKMQDKECEEILQTLSNSDHTLLNLALFNKSGLEVAKYKPTTNLDGIKEFDKSNAFKKTLEGETTMSEAHLGLKPTIPYVSLGVPVPLYGKHLAGVLAVDLQLSDVQDLVDKTRVGKDGYAYVVNESGTILAHPNKTLIGRKMTQMQPVREVIRGASGILHGKNVKGQEMLSAYAWNPKVKLGVVLNLPETEELAILKGMRNSIKDQVSQVNALMSRQSADAIREAASSMQEPVQIKSKQAQKVMNEQSSQSREKILQSMQQRAGELTKSSIEAATTLSSQSSENSISVMRPEAEKNLKAIQGRIVFYGISLTALSILIVVIWSLLSIRKITTPIEELSEIAQKIAEGDINQQIEVQTDDEIGQLARSFKKLTEYFKEVATSAEKLSKGDLTVAVKQHSEKDILSKAFTAMASDLRKSIASIAQHAQTLSRSSKEMARFSQNIAKGAEDSYKQTKAISLASETVSKNMKNIGVSMREVNGGIQEIAKNSGEAANIALKAVEIANSTTNLMGKLEQSSNEIGEVTGMIVKIAEQTKLLSLNATIESARAGEAGKGFAVVASEVKMLAKETSKAIQVINQRVQGIQGDIQSSVQAIGQISEVIHQINDISNSIAGTIEEHTITTKQIVSEINESIKENSEISQNIGALSQSVQSNSEGAQNILASATALTGMATELDSLVGHFKY